MCWKRNGKASKSNFFSSQLINRCPFDDFWTGVCWALLKKPTLTVDSREEPPSTGQLPLLCYVVATVYTCPGTSGLLQWTVPWTLRVSFHFCSLSCVAAFFPALTYSPGRVLITSAIRLALLQCVVSTHDPQMKTLFLTHFNLNHSSGCVSDRCEGKRADDSLNGNGKRHASAWLLAQCSKPIIIPRKWRTHRLLMTSKMDGVRETW
jgi:hypothetical protein